MPTTKLKKEPIKITIQTATAHTFIPSVSSLRRWAGKALYDHPNAITINIRIVTQKESNQLNRTYRHKKGPTNILSFPFEPPPRVYSSFLGDLVICAALVNKEAKQQKKMPLAHWAHLVIHGCLHLIGYDHIHIREAQEMETLEIKLLKDLGYDNPYN